MTPVAARASSTPRAMPRREVGAKTIGAAVVALAPARAVRARETIEIVDDVLGSGVEPVRGIDVVRVNYETRIAGGGRVDAGKFFVFGVGAGEVVRGFDALVAGDESTPAMRAGGKRRAVVPASMAYGQRGAGCDKDGNNCRIPPGSDLEFYVELLEVK